MLSGPATPPRIRGPQAGGGLLLPGGRANPVRLGRALLNLADTITASDPPPALTAWPAWNSWPATGAGWRRCVAMPSPRRRALAGLGDLRATEDLQDQALVAVAEAFTAAARRQPAALRHARAALGHVGALGISAEFLRWAWPLAARAAHDLADTAATRDLLALLDGLVPAIGVSPAG